MFSKKLPVYKTSFYLYILAIKNKLFGVFLNASLMLHNIEIKKKNLYCDLEKPEAHTEFVSLLYCEGHCARAMSSVYIFANQLVH